MARVKRNPERLLLDTLHEAIESGILKELLLEVAAPMKMQAKRSKDGAYRTITVVHGEEMVLSGVRLGAKGDRIIFEFKSDDPNGEYSQYELDDMKVWTAFPELESLVVRVLGFNATDTEDQPIRFAVIKPKYLKTADEREDALIAAEEREAKTKAQSAYDDHPLFGVWG